MINTPAEIYPITVSGKPNKDIRGYICARCLHSANSMRIYIKSIIQGIIITNHALERFLERRSGEHMTEEAARISILKIFAQSKPIRFKSKYMIDRFLKHNLTEVSYTYAQGLIFVRTFEEPPVIVTIESTLDRKLGEDFWYEKEE
jgi:hypothetical protein